MTEHDAGTCGVAAVSTANLKLNNERISVVGIDRPHHRQRWPGRSAKKSEAQNRFQEGETPSLHRDPLCTAGILSLTGAAAK
jgi:hypothetical protein